MNETKLVFVYNADSGILNTVKDFFHRIISPQTYECNLCAVTYSNTGMRSEWRSFIDELGYEVEILHRDEFKQKYSFEDAEFPSAFLAQGGALSYFITVDEMNSVASVNELTDIVHENALKLDVQT